MKERLHDLCDLLIEGEAGAEGFQVMFHTNDDLMNNVEELTQNGFAPTFSGVQDKTYGSGIYMAVNPLYCVSYYEERSIRITLASESASASESAHETPKTYYSPDGPMIVDTRSPNGLQSMGDVEESWLPKSRVLASIVLPGMTRNYGGVILGETDDDGTLCIDSLRDGWMPTLPLFRKGHSDGFYCVKRQRNDGTRYMEEKPLEDLKISREDFPADAHAAYARATYHSETKKKLAYSGNADRISYFPDDNTEIYVIHRSTCTREYSVKGIYQYKVAGPIEFLFNDYMDEKEKLSKDTIGSCKYFCQCSLSKVHGEFGNRLSAPNGYDTVCGTEKRFMECHQQDYTMKNREEMGKQYVFFDWWRVVPLCTFEFTCKYQEDIGACTTDGSNTLPKKPSSFEGHIRVTKNVDGPVDINFPEVDNV